jgi:uncharacterized protein YjeT (DUF2065 family)
MDSEKLASEARAKLIGGEPAAQVLQFLQSNGMEEKQAAALITDVKRERNDTLRAIGIGKIVVGSLLVCGGLVGCVLIYLFRSLSTWSSKGKYEILSVALGLYGAWKLCGGVRLLIVPQSERGDLSHLEE